MRMHTFTAAVSLGVSLLFCCTLLQAATPRQMPTGKKYVNTLGMKFVLIKDGTFIMGQQTGGDFDERPLHKVNITKSFYMAVTEVTNRQYEAFDPWHRHLRGRRGLSNKNDEAVIFVNCKEASAFCRWLSEKEGLPYRLPTEAEWEYGCRAGTTGAYSTGDTLPTEYQKNQRQQWDPVYVDLTVGKTGANPWGLHDMHGNVEEWCYDWYGPYQAAEQSDPVGRADGDFRVCRGGSHNTKIEYLRSANRQGDLADDRHWLTGFRIVIGELPKSKPLPKAKAGLWARDVDQQKYDWSRGPNPKNPYFVGPVQYVKVPPNSNGPMFSRHNHDPGLTWCDNGDIFAIWYSCRSERGRELAVLASRLRKGSKDWDAPSPFWDAPDRNDHAPCLLNDCEGTMYHFNGLSAAANYKKNLALIMRTSKDNGASWSKARLINPVRGISNQPVASTLKTKDGALMFTSDWPWHEAGRGCALWITRDKGITWSTPGGRIAGIHAGITQLADGRLMSLGRDSNIDGQIPKSISSDMGRTWSYQASGFPRIGGSQRLVLMHLRKGPLFFASYTKNMTLTNARGSRHSASGLYAALSYDDGKTWPVRRLITDGDPDHTAKTLDGRAFTMNSTTAEPKGYTAGVQTPDGVIHLISSWNYYAFNIAWLEAGTAELEF